MSKNMLVAEDSLVMQKSIGITFAHSEYQLNYCATGADALTKARETAPDIIIADANILDKNGYDLCKELKSNPSTASTPVLLLLGAHTPFDEARGKACGVDGYMIKPFETQALISKVQELTESSRSGISQVTQAQPRTPSPASTIAVSEPYTPPPVAQAPKQGISDAPFLDMDFSQASIAEPDLGLTPEDDGTGAFSILTESTQPIPKEMMSQNAFTEKPQEGGDDLWNFSEPSNESPLELDPIVPAAHDASGTQDWLELPAESSMEAPSSIPTQETDLLGQDDFMSASPESPIETSPPPATPEISNIDFGFSAPQAHELSTPEYSDFGDAPAQSSSHQKEEGSFAVSFSSDLVDPSSVTAAKPIGLSDAQVEAIVTKVFKQVIERIAWEVVPDMAERIIKEELERLTKK